MVQLCDVDLENNRHESHDNGRDLILEVPVSAVEESLREGNAIQNGQPN